MKWGVDTTGVQLFRDLQPSKTYIERLHLFGQCSNLMEFHLKEWNFHPSLNLTSCVLGPLDPPYGTANQSLWYFLSRLSIVHCEVTACQNSLRIAPAAPMTHSRTRQRTSAHNWSVRPPPDPLPGTGTPEYEHVVRTPLTERGRRYNEVAIRSVSNEPERPRRRVLKPVQFRNGSWRVLSTTDCDNKAGRRQPHVSPVAKFSFVPFYFEVMRYIYVVTANSSLRTVSSIFSVEIYGFNVSCSFFKMTLSIDLSISTKSFFGLIKNSENHDIQSEYFKSQQKHEL